MELIPDNSIDLFLCDLPYGTNKCKQDTIININKLWEFYCYLDNNHLQVC